MNNSLKVIFNVVLISILGFSLFNIISKIIDYNKANKTYTEIQDVFNNITDTSMADKYLKLKNLNPDYNFWLTIDNTNIDYPVVQGTNNSKYLKTNFNGQESASGSVFLDFRNDFKEDFNSIIYGHNMKNKTVFNNIEHYKKKEFFDENNKIYITDNSHKYTFEVFSVYTTNGKNNADSHIKINSTNDNIILQKYLNTLIDNSLFKSNLKITPTDKIITLATCSYETLDMRTIIHAKLINLETV
ncbi:MAG: class B sortase [Sarcina sp.]